MKLVGEVTGIIDTANIPKTDVLYPYRFSDFKDKFGINSFQFQALAWKLSVKGNSKYHTQISIGKTNSAHKYTKALASKVQSIIERYPDWIAETTEEFKKNGR